MYRDIEAREYNWPFPINHLVTDYLNKVAPPDRVRIVRLPPQEQRVMKEFDIWDKLGDFA